MNFFLAIFLFPFLQRFFCLEKINRRKSNKTVISGGRFFESKGRNASCPVTERNVNDDDDALPLEGRETRTSGSEERVVGLTVLMLRKRRSKNQGIKTNDSEGGFRTIIVQNEINEVRKEHISRFVNQWSLESMELIELVDSECLTQISFLHRLLTICSFTDL